jgi:hypothetical protein
VTIANVVRHNNDNDYDKDDDDDINNHTTDGRLGYIVTGKSMD